MLIDWDRIRELRDEIGEDDFGEVVEMFLEEVADAVARLDPIANDTAAAEADLHFIKSISLNLGFSGLATICQTGEKRASGGDMPIRELERIPSLYQESLVEFAIGRGKSEAAA